MPSGGAPSRLRVPPSISEAVEPVDPVLASLRIPYELTYRGPYGLQYLPIEVEAPDRTLPVARITQVTKMIYYHSGFADLCLCLSFPTQVPEGYIQDLTDYISGLSIMYSSHLSVETREEPRRRARR